MLTERRRPHTLIQDARRIVLAAFEFVADDGHLGLAVFVRDERIAHPVGFEVNGQFESIRRELDARRMRVVDLASSHHSEDRKTELEFLLALRGSFDAPALTERIGALPGVKSACWKHSD